MARTVRRTPFVRLGWRAHRWLFKATKGRLGRRMQGLPCLMLTTTGHRSGQPRDVVLQYVADGDHYVLVASYAGEPRDPAWYRNLAAHPEVTVTVDGRRLPAHASTARGPERDRLAALVTEAGHGYPDYQSRVEREIPIVTLELVPSGG